MASNVTSEFCYILNGRGGGTRVSLKHLQKSGEKRSWIHLDEENRDSVSWLENKSGIDDEVIIENLLDEDTQPRFFTTNKGLFVVLRGVNLNKDADVEDMIALRLWIEKNRVISISHRKLPAVEKLSAALGRNKGPRTPMSVFMDLAETINEAIMNVVSKIDDELDEIEDEIIDIKRSEASGMRLKVTDIRHRILGIRRYVGPQRDMFISLKSIQTEGFAKDDRLTLREISRGLSKVVDDLDFSREHSTVSQEELDSRINLQISQTMYLLSVIMVVFTPLTLFTGILGANVGGIPWADHPFGFWIITGIIAGSGAVSVFLLRLKKWI